MTSFNVHEPSSNDPMTADERNNLISEASEGFNIDQQYPEYGQQALLWAYRAGFRDGLNNTRKTS